MLYRLYLDAGNGDELAARYEKLLTDRRAEAPAALEGELREASPDLAGFFALLPEPWMPGELGRIPASHRGPVPAWTQLLPSLLAQAAEAKTLDRLAEAVDSSLAKSPKDASLAAMAILVPLARGDMAEAGPRLQAWIDRAARDAELAARAETLLIAQAAVGEADGREAGRRLLDLAFTAAGRRGDLARQAALIEATLPPDDRASMGPAHPGDLERLAAWHRDQAAASEKGRRWPAAAWHLGELVRAEPANPKGYARRAGAFAAAGERDAAAADHARFAALGGEAGPALLFVGKGDSVTVPHLAFDAFDTFTVEAWVLGWSGPLLSQGVSSDPENSVWMSAGPPDSRLPHENCGWESGRGTDHARSLGEVPRQGWFHLAMVFDGQQQLLFVNGKRVQAGPAPKPGPLDPSRVLTIGAHQYAEPNYGSGLLGALRVSTTARYRSDFTPGRSLNEDEKTALLLDASGSDADGTRLPDLSGHGRDGTIRGASWSRPGNHNEEGPRRDHRE
jgi:hypothetical protein